MPTTLGYHHRTLRELDGYIATVTGFMWRRSMRGDPPIEYQKELIRELRHARVKYYNRDPNETIFPTASALQAPGEVDQFLSQDRKSPRP